VTGPGQDYRGQVSDAIQIEIYKDGRAVEQKKKNSGGGGGPIRYRQNSINVRSNTGGGYSTLGINLDVPLKPKWGKH